MKNSYLLKIISLAIIITLTMLSVASCIKSDPKASDSTVGTTQPTGETIDPNYDSKGYLKDDITDDIKFTGKTVTILAWDDVEHEEFNPAGDTGDPVNDALVTRNRNVEQRLGITLVFDRSQKGNSSNIASWKAYVGGQVQSGSEFDIMAAYSLSSATCAVSGYQYNLLADECEYLNFEKPWWPDSLIELATINDKLFYASGDVSANALYMMYVNYVNNTLIQNNGLTHPYDLVDNNEWTYDKFIEMCEGIYIDKNGDQIKNVGDQFGYMSSGIHTDPWYYGSGGLFVEKDAGDKLIVSPTLYGSNSDKVHDTFLKITSLMYDTQDGIYTPSVLHQNEFAQGNLLFTQDRSRIALTRLNTNENLKYSIVPVPKYDSEQENYVTIMGNPFTLYSLPSDCRDIEMSSAVLEVYASEGYRNVTPALFEITLKTKYVQDETSSRMYDIIRENLCFDIGRIHSSDLISQTFIRDVYSKNLASSWTSISLNSSKQLTAKLKLLQEAYDK